MTKTYRFGIVPKATPNADGEWRKATVDVPYGMCWLDVALVLDDHVPKTHYLVAFEEVQS